MQFKGWFSRKKDKAQDTAPPPIPHTKSTQTDFFQQRKLMCDTQTGVYKDAVSRVYCQHTYTTKSSIGLPVEHSEPIFIEPVYPPFEPIEAGNLRLQNINRFIEAFQNGDYQFVQKYTPLTLFKTGSNDPNRDYNGWYPPQPKTNQDPYNIDNWYFPIDSGEVEVVLKNRKSKSKIEKLVYRKNGPIHEVLFEYRKDLPKSAQPAIPVLTPEEMADPEVLALIEDAEERAAVSSSGTTGFTSTIAAHPGRCCDTELIYQTIQAYSQLNRLFAKEAIKENAIDPRNNALFQAPEIRKAHLEAVLKGMDWVYKK